MSNDHVNPHFAVALNSFLPRRVESEYKSRATLPKPHRVYAVKINLGGEMHEVNMLASSSIAAITQAVELLEIDDDCPVDGITIDCRPAAVQP